MLGQGQRLLGIDLGEKTIGLALSDPGRIIASPLETLRRTRFSSDVETLLALMAEHGVGALVIGILPNLPGFLAGVGITAGTADFFATIYTYAWFVGLFVAGAAYLVLSKFLNK